MPSAAPSAPPAQQRSGRGELVKVGRQVTRPGAGGHTEKICSGSDKREDSEGKLVARFLHWCSLEAAHRLTSRLNGTQRRHQCRTHPVQAAGRRRSSSTCTPTTSRLGWPAGPARWPRCPQCPRPRCWRQPQAPREHGGAQQRRRLRQESGGGSGGSSGDVTESAAANALPCKIVRSTNRLATPIGAMCERGGARLPALPRRCPPAAVRFSVQRSRYTYRGKGARDGPGPRWRRVGRRGEWS